MNVTVADGKDIGRNNTTAFWTDPSWRLGWNVPLETVTRFNELRGPANLLRDRDTKRYQKAVDENGKLVGYVRFKLPEDEKWHGAWPEAKVPDVTDEDRRQLEDMHAEGSIGWEEAIVELTIVDKPVSAMNKKLKETRQGHMGECSPLML